MTTPAAKADGGILFTAVVARRKKDGALVLLQPTLRGDKFVEIQIEEGIDRAFDLYARLKKTKGEGGKYTAATLFLRSSTHRRLKFV
jgi:hypothetical protein